MRSLVDCPASTMRTNASIAASLPECQRTRPVGSLGRLRAGDPTLPPVTLDFLIERFIFARAPDWVEGSGADSASGLGDSRTDGSAF